MIPAPLKLRSCRRSCAYPAAAESISTANNIVVFILRFYPFRSIATRPHTSPQSLPDRSSPATLLPSLYPLTHSCGRAKRNKAGTQWDPGLCNASGIFTAEEAEEDCPRHLEEARPPVVRPFLLGRHVA